MKLHISKTLLGLLLAMLIAQPTIHAQIPGSISISPSSSNNYSIPPNQTTNVIRFDVTMSNLSGYFWYGWTYRVDNGAWSDWSRLPDGSTGTYWTNVDATFAEGSHTVDVVLGWWQNSSQNYNSLSSASASVNLTQYQSITVQNSFGGGSIKSDGSTYASGTSFTWAKGSTHTIEAIDLQNYGNYIRHFTDWNGSIFSLSTQITVTANATYTANFKKEFNIVFQNNYPGYGNGGVINVNGTQYNSPTSSFAVVQDQTITGGVVNTYEVINGIEYTFSSWSPGGSTSASTQFTPTDHTTYTANFNAKPLPPTNVQAGGSIGQHVTVTWTDNPNPDVEQYQIWRNRKNQSSEFVAMVGCNVGSWTDPTYTITGTNDVMLFYAVYTVWNSILSDPANAVTSGSQTGPEPRAIGLGPGSLGMNAGQSPQEYAVSSYPNPFNPSTNISYQLVEAAVVTLEIFDIVGRKLAVLINDQKSAGYHTVRWDGRDSNGKPMSSGVYLYRFLAIPTSGVNATSGKAPFRSSGKLMMTK